MRLFPILCSITDKANRHLSERTKQIMLLLFWFLITANATACFLLPQDLQYMASVLCGTALTGGMILLTLRRRPEGDASFRWFPLAMVEIIGICFLFNGIYYRVLAYIAIGLIFSVILPLLYCSISTYGMVPFFLAAAKGIVGFYFVLLLLSFLCGPSLLTAHYSAIYNNANLLGDYLIVVTTALLFLIHSTGSKTRLRPFVLYALQFSVLIFCFFSYSRTSLLSILAQIGGYALVRIILSAKRKRADGFSAFARKAGILLLTFVLTVCTVYVLFVPVKNQVARWFPSIQIRFDGNGSSQDNLGDNLIGAGSYFTKGIGGNSDGSADADEFTSGRKGIWMSFAKELQLLGHASESREVIESDRHYDSTNAHNVYLQLAYSAGIPAGIAMVLLLVWIAARLIRWFLSVIRSGKMAGEFLFAALAAIGFIFPSLTSSGYMLYTYLPATLFWVALGALVVKPQR